MWETISDPLVYNAYSKNDSWNRTQIRVIDAWEGAALGLYWWVESLTWNEIGRGWVIPTCQWGVVVKHNSSESIGLEVDPL